MRYIKINPSDNVAVAVESDSDSIPAGHKFSLCEIKSGEKIIKYGYPIGTAARDISAGEWVHTHNMKTGLDSMVEYKYEPAEIPIRKENPVTFRGFRRKTPDGEKVGIRNEIWIIPTVGCVNSVAENIASQAKNLIKGSKGSNGSKRGNGSKRSIDGIFAFTHPYGCSQLGDDHTNTQKALAGLVKHPNAGGVLVLGLGCENNNIGEFRKILGDIDSERVKFLNCQDIEDETEEGIRLISELCDIASLDEREEISSDELIIGLKCGGSDGFSGITANPVVGAFSDLLVYSGGTAILTEVPEMFGAETILMNRCENYEVFEKTVSLINDFKQYFINHGQTVYENPSPGNKDGGITTLEDKSLGCTQKCGSAAVCDVLDYGEHVKKHGLNLLSAPGNDLVASTALAVSGVHIVLFTTGRGTPFGCPVPTVKISSNTHLYEKKKNWIDFDAGTVLNTGDIEGMGKELFDYVITLASGEKHTKNEINGMREIAVFKNGVTL